MQSATLKKVLKQIAEGNDDIVVERSSRFDIIAFSESDLTELAEALRGSNVTCLTIHSNKINDDNITILSDILPETRIDSLNLRDTKLTSIGVARMLAPLRQSRVENLILSGPLQSATRNFVTEATEENRRRNLPPENADVAATTTDPLSEQPTTTINAAEIIERQRRAALEDGQGI